MKITKFGHSCVLVENDEAHILIDPGIWSEGHTHLTGIDALLITHEHQDHCDIAALNMLREINPGMVIFTNRGVGTILKEAGIRYELFEAGAKTEIKNSTIEAFGTDHALIHASLPIVNNTGYLIGGRFFHPGDTLSVYPDKTIELLALPVVAPWMRISDCIDYAQTIKPRICFPIHDGMLKHVTPFHRIPATALAETDTQFVVLEQGMPKEF